jgi:hypothetical protein
MISYQRSEVNHFEIMACIFENEILPSRGFASAQMPNPFE